MNRPTYVVFIDFDGVTHPLRCHSPKQLDEPLMGRDTPFQTPDLYSGAVENLYGGQPQFVLAFHAKTDMDSMIVYYYSGSQKWITTFRDNERGKHFRLQASSHLTFRTWSFSQSCCGDSNPQNFVEVKAFYAIVFVPKRTIQDRARHLRSTARGLVTGVP